MSQQPVAIERGAIGDAVGLAGEESADSERDILRRGPGAEQAFLRASSLDHAVAPAACLVGRQGTARELNRTSSYWCK